MNKNYGRNGNFKPRNVLMVMSQEDTEVVNQIGLELALQGIMVHSESDDEAAAGLLLNPDNNYDAVITGVEFPYVAQFVKTRPDETRAFAVAVSTNGIKSDVKLERAEDLVGYVREGLFLEAYREHKLEVGLREESKRPEMAYAQLEMQLMNASAEGDLSRTYAPL